MRKPEENPSGNKAGLATDNLILVQSVRRRERSIEEQIGLFVIIGVRCSLTACGPEYGLVDSLCIAICMVFLGI